MTDGGEKPRNRADSAAGGDGTGPESPWSRAGVPPEELVWPVTATRKIGLRGTLGRLRGSNSGNGHEFAEDGPTNAAPVNVEPWTWEILPHVRETRDGSALTRLMDRLAWHTTLPDSRYVLHAERLRRRRESLVARALVRLAALLARRPSGPPAWLAEDRRDGEK